MSGRVIRWAAVLAMGVSAAGCRPAAPVDSPKAASQPAATAPAESAPASQPAVAPPPPEVGEATVADPQPGWLQILKLDPGVEGGWATGDVDPDRNKITIETHNVSEFSIDQSALSVRWDRRVVLRINNRSVELTRKERPIIRFRQSSAGAWDVVRD